MGDHWRKWNNIDVAISANEMQNHIEQFTLGTIMENSVGAWGKKENTGRKAMDKCEFYFSKICRQMQYVYGKLVSRYQLLNNKLCWDREYWNPDTVMCRMNKQYSYSPVTGVL